jgi:hypothetical protein
MVNAVVLPATVLSTPVQAQPFQVYDGLESVKIQ